MTWALLIFIFTAREASFPRQEDSLQDSTVVIKLDPPNLEAYRNLGIHYTKLREWELAINCFKQGLNIAPRDTGLLYQLGISYYFNGDYPEAEEIFKKIIYYSPTVDAYFNLGTVLAKEKKYEEAVETLKRASALSVVGGGTDDIEVLFHLAGVYLVMGEYKSAIDTYTKIIGLVPEDPRAYEGRASAYWKLGNREMSVADLKKSKELRSGVGLWGGADTIKPEVHQRETNKAEEKKREEEPLEVYTNDPEILYCVGEIHQITGEYELAVKTYTLAIRINPNNPKYYRERARVYKLLGKTEEAMADLEKVAKLVK